MGRVCLQAKTEKSNFITHFNILTGRHNLKRLFSSESFSLSTKIKKIYLESHSYEYVI